ncbi:MAG: DUF3047 domain-containing protein [Rhodobacteraceae bacterium]|nr:MAG: DUF3047 domain-containing protein [Paracoccaceae bacterium]
MPDGHLSRRHALATGLGAVLCLGVPRRAEARSVPFDAAWEHLTFRRLTPNRFELRNSSLRVVADGSSSILYRMLPAEFRAATRASWSWQVESSVPPSDLSQIGNDDRNLGVFFVSMSAQAAESVRPDSNLRRLMTNRSARVLMYTWGGDGRIGAVVPSPHAPDRLRNLVTRPAQTGRFSESVDLDRDFTRVFGAPIERLVAVAVSSNSENTPARVVAQVSDLSVS